MGVILLDTTRNPWRVDATGGALALPLIITTDMCTIDRMEWTSENAAQNDEVEVTDSPVRCRGRKWASPVGVSMRAGADSFQYQRQKTVRPAQGICITALTTGTLLIYYA